MRGCACRGTAGFAHLSCLLGPEDITTWNLRRNQARALYQPSGAPLGDVRRAVEILEDVVATSHRVLGPGYPSSYQEHLDAAREKLARAEAPVAARTRRNKTES